MHPAVQEAVQAAIARKKEVNRTFDKLEPVVQLKPRRLETLHWAKQVGGGWWPVELCENDSTTGEGDNLDHRLVYLFGRSEYAFVEEIVLQTFDATSARAPPEGPTDRKMRVAMAAARERLTELAVEAIPSKATSSPKKPKKDAISPAMLLWSSAPGAIPLEDISKYTSRGAAPRERKRKAEARGHRRCIELDQALPVSVLRRAARHGGIRPMAGACYDRRITARTLMQWARRRKVLPQPQVPLLNSLEQQALSILESTEPFILESKEPFILESKELLILESKEPFKGPKQKRRK